MLPGFSCSAWAGGWFAAAPGSRSSWPKSAPNPTPPAARGMRESSYLSGAQTIDSICSLGSNLWPYSDLGVFCRRTSRKRRVENSESITYVAQKNSSWLLGQVSKSQSGVHVRDPSRVQFLFRPRGGRTIFKINTWAKMPDYQLGTHKPVVRKFSSSQKDFFNKFERPSNESSTVSSSLASSGTTTPALARSRPGSIKKLRSKSEVRLHWFIFCNFTKKKSDRVLLVRFCFGVISLDKKHCELMI